MKKISNPLSTTSTPLSPLDGCILDLSNYELKYDSQFSQYNNIKELMRDWFLIPENDWAHGWGIEAYSAGMVSLHNSFVRLSALKIPFPTVTVPYSLNHDPRDIRYVSGQLRTNFTVGTDKRGTDPNSSKKGFSYGVFEASLRLPENIPGVWPTFWFSSGPSEIDILDSYEKDKGKNNVINFDYPPPSPLWQEVTNPSTSTPYQKWTSYQKDDIVYDSNTSKYYQALTDIGRFSCRSYLKISDKVEAIWRKGFNKFTTVWNPNEVTFFVNGIRTNTVSNNEVITFDNAGHIIIGLQFFHENPNNPIPGSIAQMDFDEFNAKEIHLDVEYFKFYKPLLGSDGEPDYNLPYVEKYNPFSNLEQLDQTSIPADGDLIVSDNGVFYRAQNQIQRAQFTSNNWVSSTPMAGISDIKGKLVEVKNGTHIFYHNNNDGISLQYEVGGIWSHQELVLGTNKFKDNLIVPENGNQVFYRGLDNRIYNYYRLSPQSPWQHHALGNASFPALNNVKGSLKKQGSRIFYRSNDDELYVTYYNNGWQYYAIGNLNNVADEIVTNNDGTHVYYIGLDNKIHHYYQKTGIQDWGYMVLANTIPNASHNLRHHPLQDKIYYIDNKNRLNNIYLTTGSPGPLANWNHSVVLPHIDGLGTDLSISEDGKKIWYLGLDQRVKMFFWTKGWYHLALSSDFGKAVRELVISKQEQPFFIDNEDRIANQWTSKCVVNYTCHGDDLDWSYS